MPFGGGFGCEPGGGDAAAFGKGGGTVFGGDAGAEADPELGCAVTAAAAAAVLVVSCPAARFMVETDEKVSIFMLPQCITGV